MPTTLDIPRNDTVQAAYTPIPEDAQLPPLPTRADNVCYYQQLLVNVRTGNVTVFCADWRVHALIPAAGEDRTLWDAQHPGRIPNIAPYSATEAVPEVLLFHIDTWTAFDYPTGWVPPTPAWVHMTREQCNAFGAGVVPLVQELVTNLFRVPGTGDLEWSAESVAAAYALSAACSRDQQGRIGEIVRDGMINYGEAVAAMPSLVEGGWAEMDDAQLNQVADSLCRFTGRWHPELKAQFGKPYSGGSGIRLDCFGSRAWLYAYRAHEAGTRPVVNATTWFADPGNSLASRVSANDDDDAITRLAQREQVAAADRGVKLVRADRFIRSYRDELRRRIVEDDLARAREAVERLAQAKAARAGLLGQIIGWGDQRYYSDNDAELGRRAGMTRQAVNQLRNTLAGDTEA